MRKITAIALCFIVSGCANMGADHRPIIDTQGVNMTRYNQDLSDCSGFAKQADVGSNAAGGAVAGALLYGLLGAALGNHGDASRMAGAGALIGGAGMGGSTVVKQENIVKRCMSGRGYRVLE